MRRKGKRFRISTYEVDLASVVARAHVGLHERIDGDVLTAFKANRCVTLAAQL